MMDYLRKFYRRLPIVRELREIQKSLEGLNGLNSSIRRLETAAMIQALATVKGSDPRYQDPQRLLASGAQHWSREL